MSKQAGLRRLSDLASICLLPFRKQRHHFFVRKRRAFLLDRFFQLFEPGLLLRRRQEKDWLGVAGTSVETFFRYGIEEGEKLVELLLRDRIVLVVVASGA